MSGMSEVLAGHQWYDATSDNEDPATGCTGCDDWFGSEDALDDGTFAAHQADMLTAAGFGPVKEAKAQALEEAADERAVRSETFLTTMQNMVGQADYTNEDIIRYGAYSSEALTTSAWLRARAAAARLPKSA